MVATKRSAPRQIVSPVNFFTSHGVFRNPEISLCGSTWQKPPCDQNVIKWPVGECAEPAEESTPKEVCDEAPGYNKSLAFDVYRGEIKDKCSEDQNLQQALADRMSMSLAQAIYDREDESDPTPTLVGCAEDIGPSDGTCVCPELALGLLATRRSLTGSPGGQFVIPMEAVGIFTEAGIISLDGRGYRGPLNWPVLVDAGIPVKGPNDPAGTARIFVTGAIEWNVDNLNGVDQKTEESWEAEILNNLEGRLVEARAQVDMDDCGVFTLCVSLPCDCAVKPAEETEETESEGTK